MRARVSLVFAATLIAFLPATMAQEPATQRASDREPSEAAGLPDLPSANVSIPWRELRMLLDKSGEPRPPVEFVFAAARYEAVIAGGQVAVNVTAEVTTLGEGWALIPLGPADQGVVSAKLGERPCPLVVRDDTLFALLSETGAHKLSLDVRRNVDSIRGTRQFALPLVPSPVVSVSVTIPQGNQTADVKNALVSQTQSDDDATTIEATFRGGQIATISWRDRPAADQPARLHVETLTLASVQTGRLACTSVARYEIFESPASRLRIALPDDAELLRTSGADIRATSIAAEGKLRILTVELTEPAADTYELTVEYMTRFKPTEAAPVVPLIAHPDAESDRGFLAVEVRGNYDVTPQAVGLERIDVKELPRAIWDQAAAPLLFAFRYDAPMGELALRLTRHTDLEVLVAMSDVCEASTVVTADGKSITKMMYVVRNNLKPFMKLTLPDGAQVWSVLVDDRPVTPARDAQGNVLIPLKKSDEVDDDDEDSYRARRERRRDNEPDDHGYERMRKMQELRRDEPRDLKPYDVELVLLNPAVELGERGDVPAQLPQCDIPVGHLAWAVFLPGHLRVVDSAGNMREVRSFNLPFRHFGEATYLSQMEQERMARAVESLKQAEQAIAEAKDDARQAMAEGVLPVRVEIPVTGEIYRFEKFLVVEETPQATLIYREASY